MTQFISFAPDVEKKINEVFAGELEKAREILRAVINDDNSNQRTVRCVLVLSKGSLSALQEAVKAAQIDYRDVIFGAEYDKAGNHVADYNKPFSS